MAKTYNIKRYLVPHCLEWWKVKTLLLTSSQIDEWAKDVRRKEFYRLVSYTLLS